MAQEARMLEAQARGVPSMRGEFDSQPVAVHLYGLRVVLVSAPSALQAERRQVRLTARLKTRAIPAHSSSVKKSL